MLKMSHYFSTGVSANLIPSYIYFYTHFVPTLQFAHNLQNIFLIYVTKHLIPNFQLTVLKGLPLCTTEHSTGQISPLPVNDYRGRTKTRVVQRSMIRFDIVEGFPFFVMFILLKVLVLGEGANNLAKQSRRHDYDLS